MSLLNSALWYASQSMSIFPTGRDKRPLIKWEKYQKERATPEQIKEWWTKFPDANIGIVTGAISGIVVVDIDTEEGHDEIQKYIPESLETPTANTPKGGQHLYFKLPKIELRNNCRTIPGTDFRGEGGYVLACPSVNGNGKGYEWTLSPKLVSFAELPQAYINEVNKPAMAKPKTITEEMFTEGRRDNDLFHIANVMSKGGAPAEEINQVLLKLMSSWGEHDEQWAMAKSQSAIERVERKERNLSEEVREWVNLTNGFFSLADSYNTLHLLTKQEKANCQVIMHRLLKERLIERVGNKNGHFRKVDSDCEVMPWQDANDNPFPIKWPFAMEKFVNICCGNIIIIAGETNSGKTSFSLNTALMNSAYKVHYFSSEMGPQELKRRIKKFGRNFKDWDHVTFRERTDNFGDVVVPGEGNINIIDYMEEGDEAWKVKTHIDEVWKKLDGAIGIICLQKPKGRDEAYGGEGTKRRARLYVSLKWGEAKLIKVKDCVDDIENPKDQILKYKLIAGSGYIINEDWHHPDEPTAPTKRPWYHK